LTLLAFFSAALAADPVSAITEQLHGDEGPAVAFACAPLSDTFAVLDRAGIGSEMLMMMPENVKYWLSMSDPAVALEAGVDLDGSLIMTADEGEGMDRAMSLSIPFSGSGEQATAMLERIGPRKGSPPGASMGGWDVSGSGGGHFQLRSGPLDAVTVNPALLSGLPSVPGCAILATDIAKEKMSGSILIHAPFVGENEPLRIRISTPGSLTFPSLTVPPQLPDIRTDTVPMAVAVVRFEPIALLQQESFWSEESLWEEMGEKPGFSQEDVDKVAERLRVMPGTTIALFGNPKEPQWAATLPVANPEGRALSTWKLRRGMKKADSSLEWSSRTTFTISRDEGPISGEISKGTIRLASSDALLSEARSDSGTPWISEAHAAHVADWPVSVYIQAPELIPGIPEISAYVGVQLQPEYLEMSLSLPERRGELLSGLMKMVMMGAMQRSREAPAPEVTPL
jgi:hypothetical protein